MRKRGLIVVIVSIMITTTYIFGLDQYDHQDLLISKLYKAISLPKITYEEMQVEIYGQGEGEKQFAGEILNKASRCSKYLSHDTQCSKLCMIKHANNAELQTINEANNVGMHLKGRSGSVSYLLEMDDLEDGNHLADYKMTIKGDRDIEKIDFLRDRSIDLFNRWQIDVKENIYFVGKIKGNLSRAQRTYYEEALMSAVHGTNTEHYVDDVSQDVEAYYGYTPLIKAYNKDQYGNKVNTQISFSYNEILDETSIIVAFPFYNEPF